MASYSSSLAWKIPWWKPGESRGPGCPCPPLERAPGCLGWNQFFWSPCGLVGTRLHPGPSERFHVSTLQVLHQVVAVAGLPRVPEEHDVWSEVQALQVMSGWGVVQRWERGHRLHTFSPVSLATWFLSSGQTTVQRNSFESSKIYL